jgi:Uma2 family endonuclease
MTILNATKLTAEQFMMLGEDPPGVRLELVHGGILVSPSPSFSHSYADRVLSHILLGHIEEHHLGALVGDVDTIFDVLNVRRPDIIFISKARLPLITGRAIPIAPDLCVEILSPSTATMDQVDKFALYAKHGVPHYWMVDPKGRTFEAYALRGGEYQLLGTKRGNEIARFEPFADLEIPLARLWAPSATV